MRLRTLGLILTLAFSILVVPLTAEAQHAGKVRRIGVLVPGHPPTRPALEAFRRGLRELGCRLHRVSTLFGRFHGMESVERFLWETISGLVWV